MPSPLRMLFESIPVLLAIAAIFFCMNVALRTRRAHDRHVYLCMVICAALMIVAQSSWTFTILSGDILGTDSANIMWTAFNSMTMLTFILASRRYK